MHYETEARIKTFIVPLINDPLVFVCLFIFFDLSVYFSSHSALLLHLLSVSVSFACPN